VWTPLARVAVIGLGLAGARRDPLAIGGAASLLGLLWIYGSWQYYTLGSSYGMRGFVDGSFFFCLGLAEVLDRLGRASARVRPFAVAARVAIVALMVWNLYFAVCYRCGLQPPDRPFAGQGLFADGARWRAQFSKDTNLLKMLKREKFPLFTPADGEPPAARRGT
jgi:hypothetical protein